MKFELTIIIMLLLTTLIFPQKNREEALTQGGWSGGIAGWLGWENFDISQNLENVNYNSKVDGFNFVFSSRNGSIVETNAVFGFDFQWRQKDRTTVPDPNPDNSSETLNEKIWFLGLWARYYFPMGGNFALFIEGSGGYTSFSQKNQIITTLEYAYDNNEAYANGFAYNGGLGFSHFVTNTIAFEITGRWEGGSLNGENKNYQGNTNDLNIKLGNIFFLFGFQVYLR